MERKNIHHATMPMRFVGPVSLISKEITQSIMIPLITYESPLWSSVGRGARVTTLAGGIKATVIDDRMTRSILLEAPDTEQAFSVSQAVKFRQKEMNALIAQHSRFTQLIGVHTQIVGNLLYMRFEFTTGDASGHNMVTLCAEKLQSWLQESYPSLSYVSISSNLCSDKKATAINGILGRGKNVVAEVSIPRILCQKKLHSSPEAITNLNTKKNLIGTIIAGGIRSANAHYANMLLAFYLATGQDAANIVEGSQGITFAEVRQNELYFSVTLPNLIVGTVGNGKNFDFVMKNLAMLDCLENRAPGINARRLAIICAAAVLCGEISLLAAQTNEGELMKSHLKLEREHA